MDSYSTNAEQLKKHEATTNSQPANLLTHSIASLPSWKREQRHTWMDKLLQNGSFPCRGPSIVVYPTKMEVKKGTAVEQWLQCLRYVLKINKRVALRLRQVNFWPSFADPIFTSFFKGGMLALCFIQQRQCAFWKEFFCIDSLQNITSHATS